MRKPLIAANWKMNLDFNQGFGLFTDLLNMLAETDSKADVVVFPPAVFLRSFFELKDQKRSTVELGGQDCSGNTWGAYTGEISSGHLASSGAKWCLIGHSERRQYHLEKDELLLKKLNRAFEAKLNVVFCVGENGHDRESGRHKAVVSEQVAPLLEVMKSNEDHGGHCELVIAYEPVWAIGTGQTATPVEAQEMHAHIRQLLQEALGEKPANNTRILYGGSVNPKNSQELFAQADIDGALVGGASLNAADFVAIVKSV
ncbi:MAG: triose-phosphate isomerase [Salibacteraceae bacterium]